MADIPSAIAYGVGAQGQATFATGPSTAVWAYSPWDSTTVTATAAGTVPVSSAAASTLYRGNVSFGAGTLPTSGSQVTVTFSATLPSVPFVVLTATTAQTGTINPNVLSASTTAFVIGAGVAPTANQAGTVYSVNYLMSL
jgi:hypothetical protein